MQNEWIQRLAVELRQNGYAVETDPKIPRARCLLYAFSPTFLPLGFARVADHFLFVDWEYELFHQMDRLLETYQAFSQFVNQGFRVPHALRLHIPNLVVAAVSWSGFPEQTQQFVRSRYLSPWYGGEAGQLVLVDAQAKQVICHYPPRFRQPGSLPLAHAAVMIKKVCLSSLLAD